MEKQRYFENRVEIGIALLIVGMQFGTAIKNVLGGLDLVNFIMILSCVLIINYKNLFCLRFPRFNLLSVILIIFQLLMFIYGIVCKSENYTFFLYNFYIIFIIIGLFTQEKQLQYNKFFKYMFFICGFISLVIFWQATDSGTRFITSYHETGKLWLKFGGDPITMPRVLEIDIIINLLYQTKNSIEKILRVFFTFTSIIGLLSFSNRATIIITIIVVCIYLYIYQKKKLKKTLKTYLLISIVIFISIIALLILYKCNRYFYTQINTLTNSIKVGVSTFLGKETNSIDLSAQNRVLMRRKIFNIMKTNFGIINCLIGYGYNKYYIDMPILQAFFDGGFLGLFLYGFYTLYIPLKEQFNKKNTTFIMFIKLFSIQTILDQFYCGLPYYFFFFIPAILILFAKPYNNCKQI